MLCCDSGHPPLPPPQHYSSVLVGTEFACGTVVRAKRQTGGSCPALQLSACRVQRLSGETSYPGTEGARAPGREAAPTVLLPPSHPTASFLVPACFTARSPASLLSPETCPVKFLSLKPRVHFHCVQPERAPASLRIPPCPQVLRACQAALHLAKSYANTWPSWVRTADPRPCASTPPREPPALPPLPVALLPAFTSARPLC